jgi:hypothetical protein
MKQEPPTPFVSGVGGSALPEKMEKKRLDRREKRCYDRQEVSES